MPPFISHVGNKNKRKNEEDSGSIQPQKRRVNTATLASYSEDAPTVAVDSGRLPPTYHASSNRTTYWDVAWRMPQARKHKTWDDDGILVVGNGRCQLLDMNKQQILSAKVVVDTINVDDELKLGGREILINHELSTQEFHTGRSSVAGPSTPSVASPAASAPTRAKPLPSPRIFTPPVAKPQPKPLTETANVPPPMNDAGVKEYWYSAQWRKPQTRKNKTWDGDAIISHQGSKLTLMDEDGTVLGSKTHQSTLLPETLLFISGREIQVDARIPKPSFGKDDDESVSNDFIPPTRTAPQPTPFRAPARVTPQQTTLPMHAPKSAVAQGKQKETTEDISSSAPAKGISAVSFYAQPKRTLETRHDPNAEGALVMPAPSKKHQAKYNKKGLSINPVVVDPAISRFLRPHQREGVTFMYESVMGMKKHEGQGCILADGMGLGKTLQTIALIWTLLRQNCYGSGGTVGKVLIVCPVGLIRNWQQEFHKWLGRDRIRVFLGNKDKTEIKRFLNSLDQVLIIGYERLRSVIDELQYCQPRIGLIICDEGHRLKSSGSKTTKMFDALKTPRRIILSGTPVQNNLGEFHTMADFVNPGLLDSYKSFNRTYEVPIMKSRSPDCSEKESAEGSERAAQLSEISRSFVLRRTDELLSDHLPTKHEYVVFIRPTKLQLDMFQEILGSDHLDDLVAAGSMSTLALISRLMKLCNTPWLLAPKKDKPEKLESMAEIAIKRALRLLPQDAKDRAVELSGKMIALQKLLKHLRSETDEKIVIVSHYTATLDVIESLCLRKKYKLLRLDGQTKSDERQQLVNRFNKTPQSTNFVFLLSAKAGGTGITLFGASRLVLFDSDWNPAHDLQAMARIHRDGQKRPVFIYRFLTAGTIDEKIYQRGVTKMGLSESLIGNGGTESAKGDQFSASELRDLYTVHPQTACHTHRLLDCYCDTGTIEESVKEHTSEGVPSDPDSADEEIDAESGSDSEQKGFIRASQYKPRKAKKEENKKLALKALDEWTHVHALNSAADDSIEDNVLVHLIRSDHKSADRPSILESLQTAADQTDEGSVAFVFQKITKSQAEEVDE